MYYINALLSGILVTAIGAVPFGLVNLYVLDISNKRGARAGMTIAFGAALVEVIYGITAIMAGMVIIKLLDEYSYLNYIIASVIGLVGVMFFFKKTTQKGNSAVGIKGFWKGVFLNLISIQVLLFWLVAIPFLYSQNRFNDAPAFVFTFLAGIWIGKISVLWIYARMSRIILSKSDILARNINRIIGVILLITGMIQIIKL